MQLSQVLDKNSAFAAACTSTQSSKAEPEEQWEQVVRVSGHGVWDGTEQRGVKTLNPGRYLLQFVCENWECELRCSVLLTPTHTTQSIKLCIEVLWDGDLFEFACVLGGVKHQPHQVTDILRSWHICASAGPAPPR